ncbi:DUF5796 family protein [Salinarchaeum laminariae]|uniref:DUF5796 family protein n=1 Tax=Salinarchaeum laminariae TaxID=869888 RepID=UPI0020BFA491|nr:DUF5796 family protein [Salinarchaeum laminariae]
MSHRSTVSPSTLPVDLREEGVVVEYLDEREAFYNGVPAKREGSVRTRPGVLVQVLVTDPTDTEGVLTYVNDRSTHDDILEETGVGRVFVEPGEETELFPGVTARAEGHAIVIEGEPEVARGRIFVFAEDEMGEASYEIVREDTEAEEGAQIAENGQDQLEE